MEHREKVSERPKMHYSWWCRDPEDVGVWLCHQAGPCYIHPGSRVMVCTQPHGDPCWEKRVLFNCSYQLLGQAWTSLYVLLCFQTEKIWAILFTCLTTRAVHTLGHLKYHKTPVAMLSMANQISNWGTSMELMSRIKDLGGWKKGQLDKVVYQRQQHQISFLFYPIYDR